MSALVLFGFLALWGVFLFRAAPSVGVGDSGEFIAAAATLSIPHPPSYPLFTLLGKAWQVLVPWGHAGYRCNIFSAALGTGAAALLYLLARRWGLGRPAAFFGAALAAAGAAFVHNVGVTEVFALNTFWALAVLAALFIPSGGPVLSAFLWGLGIGNHHTLVLLAPGWVVLAWARGLSLRTVLSAGVAFAAGLGVYVFLPLRSAREPLLDWANPETLPGLWRTFLRKDYGTLSLALGEAPARTAANAWRQLERFFGGWGRQLLIVGVPLAAAGLWSFWKEDRRRAAGLFLLWAVTGPFFAWLGNLSFDAQSDGVLQRFYILPAVLSALAAARALDPIFRRAGVFGLAILALPLFGLWRSAEAHPLRADTLALDYGRNIFRALPPGAGFFMDGGDDTFFATAFLQFVQRARPDVRLFDRGGLIFRSVYGADFRALDKTLKEERRRAVENAWRSHAPLYYSTMNEKILPGAPLSPAGFLYGAAESTPNLWPFYVFRAPSFSPEDYRARALLPYFSFLKARWFWRSGRYDEALAALAAARAVGRDVPWVRVNVSVQTLEWAYEALLRDDLPRADRLADMALGLDGRNVTALCDKGLVAQKRGDLPAAGKWFEAALAVQPDHVDAAYNLSVVRWQESRWEDVVRLLRGVLARAPGHAQAQRYLPAAEERRRAAGGKP